MVDSRFFQKAPPLSITKILKLSAAELYNKTLQEVEDLHFKETAPLKTATKNDITFYDNSKYLEAFQQTKAGACFIAKKNIELIPQKTHTLYLLSENPSLSFAKIARVLYSSYLSAPFVSEKAYIDPSAVIGKGCTIKAGVVIEEGVCLGPNTIIEANTVIKRGVQIGSSCYIGSNVTLEHCLLGNQIIIQNGAAIGQPGFGFVTSETGLTRIPQLGRVIIEDFVEIGANTTIDRGSTMDTLIGSGTKIDNLVQIAHNVHIGPHSVIVAQVGIAGSTHIGTQVMIGGQAGLTEHLNIEDGARIAAQSGVMRDVKAKETVSGSPAVPIQEWLRQNVLLSKMVRKRKGK